MSENFNLEIVSPDRSVLKTETYEVVIPSYEGEMGIMKDHIPLITFLRPGIIKVYSNDNDSKEFFVQDGTVEFFNDNLVILSSSVINVKDLSKNFIENLSKNTQEQLAKKDITDHDRYILNHKLQALNEIRV